MVQLERSELQTLTASETQSEASRLECLVHCDAQGVASKRRAYLRLLCMPPPRKLSLPGKKKREKEKKRKNKRNEY